MNAASPEPAVTPGSCPVCGGPLAPADVRCVECNYDLAGLDGRPGAYSRVAMWWTVVVFVAIYVIVLVVVAATR